jgi:hypothetical protein
MALYLHYPNTPSWRGAQLKHRDNFAFNFYLSAYVNLMSSLMKRLKSSCKELDTVTKYTCISLRFVSHANVHLCNARCVATISFASYKPYGCSASAADLNQDH